MLELGKVGHIVLHYPLTRAAPLEIIETAKQKRKKPVRAKKIAYPNFTGYVDSKGKIQLDSKILMRDL